MKRSHFSFPRIALLTSVLFVVLAIGGVAQTKTPGDAFVWRDGDIVFQGSISPQCEAIEQATGSPWTHCGIVFTDASGPYVIEAVQPVRRTGLKEWLARGHNGVYIAKRLKEPLDPVAVERMKAAAKAFMGNGLRCLLPMG